MEVGCTAAASIDKLQGAIYWLGQSAQGAGVVYRAKGYQPERISTFALEKVIANLFHLEPALTSKRAELLR